MRSHTCLSSESHDSIKDDLLHYLGCLEFSEREHFFNDSNLVWVEQAKHQLKPNTSDTTAKEHAKAIKDVWKKNCDKELSRIIFLRDTLAEDNSERHLVEKVNESATAWRKSRVFRENIDRVRQWRHEQGKKNQVVQQYPETRDRGYVLQKDVSVPIIQFENGRGVDEKDLDGSGKPRADRVWGTFPNQKTKVDALFSKCEADTSIDEGLDDNLLHRRRHTGRIRYYHFPSNNMSWAEPAILVKLYLITTQFTESYKESREHRLIWSSVTHTGEASYMVVIEHLLTLATCVLYVRLFRRVLNPKTFDVKRRTDRVASDHEGHSKNMVLFTSSMLSRNISQPTGKVEWRLFEGMVSYRDKKLLEEYLCKDEWNRSMHPRRTLDQAYFWTLNTTRSRDRDQVVYRHTTARPEAFHSFDWNTNEWSDHKNLKIEGNCEQCKDNIRKVSRVIMVDQLWLWVLDASTIITCFPKRYGQNKHDASGVHKSIRVAIEGAKEVRTVFDLALIILDECSKTFFDRTKKLDRQPLLIDAFSKAIGNIMHKQTVAFEQLWRWTDEASKIYRSNTTASDLHVPLLDINPEGKLEREIKDIIEELDIILHVIKCHRDIIKKFIFNAEHMLDPYGEYSSDRKKGLTSKHLWNQFHRRPSAPHDGSPNGHLGNDSKRHDYNWFKLNADECLESVLARPWLIYDQVKDLLELKQQQASVVQAWQSVKQSDEAIKQGRSIMMFTLVTIVFLPLSFMSSVFGMNSLEFSGDTWDLKDELKLMFAVSSGVIFLSLIFSLSTWCRAAVWYLYNKISVTFVVRSRLFRVWLDLDMPSSRLSDKGERWATKLKNDVRQARFKDQRKKNEEKEKAQKRAAHDGAIPMNGGNETSHSGNTGRFKGPHMTQSSFGTRHEEHQDVEAGLRPSWPSRRYPPRPVDETD
ncbi:uncharacterized protein JN550_012414 [Neoarthrinium moseri]|uniref:uncharacterized protein n=1 Tax=Neoarthrinium moseri TaxID=1658444 RepID=UPI001FDB0DF1|nr:uncharacterized protein JN550_012414 [Neoarthrinium moseri]KAI1858852.1 hypothetical protein JN550_012414 [Neoarthrinium moseri]